MMNLLSSTHSATARLQLTVVMGAALAALPAWCPAGAADEAAALEPTKPVLLGQAQPGPTAAEPQPPPDQAGWLRDARNGCRVWVPAWLRGGRFELHWSGPCQAGRAEGQGVATIKVMPQDHSPRQLRGHFRDGVFLGDAPFANEIVKLPMSDVLIALPTGGLIGAEFWLHQIFASDASIALCDRHDPSVIAVAPAHLSALDEDGVKRFMRRAAEAARAACATAGRARVRVVPFNYSRAIDGNRTAFRPEIASAEVYGLNEGKAELTSYRNDAAAAEERRRRAERSQQRRQDYAEHAAKTREAFRAFTAQAGVVNWVKAEQVEANPFRWQNKVVGMRVDFLRMISPSMALVAGQKGDRLLLTGVPTDLFTGPAMVVVAGRVGPRLATQVPERDGSNRTMSLVQLALVKAHPCTLRGCMDLFEWLGHDFEKFPWGGDQSQFLD